MQFCSRGCGSSKAIIAVLMTSCTSVSAIYSVAPSTGSSASRLARQIPRSSLQAGEVVNSMTVSYLVQWFNEHSQQSDGAPDSKYVESNADMALKARTQIKAASQVTEEVFLHHVLPFRHLDEPVDAWRPFFFEKLAPHVKDKESLKDVADFVIPYVFHGLGKKVEFKGNNTPGIMAPVSETFKHGYASCTGLSIFVADALRSVGVPARVVGTPEWNLPTGGNHNWIEVWLGDGWHYTDATPVDKVQWDKAWFTASNTQKAIPGGIHGIYTTVVDKNDADSKYPFTWRLPTVQAPALDRTLAYTQLAHSAWDPSWEQYRQASEGLR